MMLVNELRRPETGSDFPWNIFEGAATAALQNRSLADLALSRGRWHIRDEQAIQEFEPRA
jgi:hypothetical protein